MPLLRRGFSTPGPVPLRKPLLAMLLFAATAGVSVEALPSTAQDPSDPQMPRYRGTVDRVRIDVIVTDENGKFVTDLRPEDFVLYEDGEPQPLLGFQLVDLAAGAVIDLTTTGVPAAEDLHRTGGTDAREEAAVTATPAAALDTRPSDLGAMVFLIDGPSIDPDIRASFSNAWRHILDQTDVLRIPRAVYFVSSVGRVEELVPLTEDLRALRSAAEAVGSLPTYGTTMEQRLRELMDAMEDPRAPGTAGWSLKLRALEDEERARSIDTLELLTEFCDALSMRSGRTALVWVSTGIKLTEGGPAAAVDAAQESVDPDRPLSPRDSNWAYFTTDSALARLQERLHEVANSANVSIYSIDPTPLASLRSGAFDASVGGNAAMGGGSGRDAGARSIPRADIMSSSILQDSLEGMRDSLRSAAEDTGGMAMINYTDLGVALGEIRDHASRFYLLTYAPPSPVSDGEFHRVRVEVDRPGMTVRERGGYIAMPAGERKARAVAAAMALPGAARTLDMRADAYRRRSASGKSQVQIGVSFRRPDLAPAATPEVDLFLTVFDSQRRLVRQVERGIRARTVSPVPGLTTAVVPFSDFDEGWWDLPMGKYEIRLVVNDPLGGPLGATSIDLEVPAGVGTWNVSDVRLGVVKGGSSALPLVGGVALAGQQLVAFVEVSGGAAPELSGRIEGGRSVEIQRVLMRPADVSTHRGALPLPAGLPPGRYVLELLVDDPAVGKQRTFRVPLELLPR